MKSFELKSLDSANYIIGKSAKYYTLWQIVHDVYAYNPESNKSEKCVRYEYIQNISLNKEDLGIKCPQLNINECISGSRSFNVFEKKEEVMDFSKFTFGKYRGNSINDNEDIDYLKWYFYNCNEEQRPIISSRLREFGFHIVNNSIMSEEEYIEYMKGDELFNEFNSKANNHENLEVIFESNLIHHCEDDFAGLCDMDRSHDIMIEYRFPNYSENHYNGYSYYLPTLNGKAKRIKNKKMIITDYDYAVVDNKYWKYNIIITVKNFKIEK